MSAICGKLGELWLMGGTPTTITKEACENVSGYTYHITAPAKRYLDPATAVLVYDNNVLQTSGYVIAGGCQIQFDADPTGPVTVSGKYLPTGSETTFVQNWQLTLDQGGIFETTSLGATARSYVNCGLVGWSGSFERFYEDATWEARLVAGTNLLIKLYEDEPSDRVWTGYIYLTDWTQTVSVDALQKETLSFQGSAIPAYAADES